MMSDDRKKVYVVVLNWNGWRDTVECLESLLRLTYPAMQIVVCDNASTDGSESHILRWAAGEEPAAEAATPSLRPLTHPPYTKPLCVTRHDRERGERGGSADDASLTLVQTGANLGFAGGCNVGIRYALARGDASYIWLLNNDTVAAPEALTALVRRMSAKPNAGMCGSRVHYYAAPSEVQTLAGGRYNRWLATGHYITPAQQPSADEANVERVLDYIVGASMLVRRQFVEDVGALSERYFLYFEEIDWATRSRGRWTLAYANDSVIYHKEGRSIGTNADPRRRSATADHYTARNRLKFTRVFFPMSLPTVWLGVLGMVLNRVRRGQYARAWDLACLLVKPALWNADEKPDGRREPTELSEPPRASRA